MFLGCVSCLFDLFRALHGSRCQLLRFVLDFFVQTIEDREDGAFEILLSFEVRVCQRLDAISSIPQSADENLLVCFVSCSRRDLQFRPCSDQNGGPLSKDLR
jgi:hypothetical protein